MSKKFEFWGIDGCTTGWCCVGLNAENGSTHFIGRDIAEVYEQLKNYKAKIALIDIPIGLSDNSRWRLCDTEARDFVKSRKQSVFPVPCRQAIHAYRKEEGRKNKIKAGKIASVKITGGCLSEQTWGIAPKIEEVDSFLCENKESRELFREVHPEVCFCALNGKKPLNHGKKIKQRINPKGFEERMDILKKQIFNAEKIFNKMRSCYPKKEVGDDDIHDALAAAITAKRGEKGGYNTLPENPQTDSCGLPMEMVYV